MDIAGFITGLPGLLTACAQIYDLTITARRMGDDGVLLVTKIAIEQAKFQAWLEDVGWLSESGPKKILRPVLQRVVKDILEGIKLTLTSLGALVDKYELDEGGEVTSLRFALPHRFWKLAPQGQGSSITTKSRDISKKNRVKRLVWAAGDATHARELVDDLRRFNEDLRAASGTLQRATFSLLPSKVLPQVFDNGNLDRLIEASAQDEPALSRCAAIRKEVLDTLKGSEDPPDAKSPLRKSPTTFQNKVSGKAEPRRVATYHPPNGTQQTVILEDKYFAAPNEADFTEKRVQELAHILGTAPKPEELRVLDCLGYVPFRPKKCFSFIYSFPEGANVTEDPVSLADILPSGKKSVQKPPLGIRFQLCRSLSVSLLLLQACGVLHKGLKAESIVFFKFSADPEYDFSRPYIVGFDYARPSMARFASDASEVLEPELGYAHPEYNFTRNQRYVEIFDIYSAGLLHLQVGLWQNLADILDEWTPQGEKKPTNRVGIQKTIVSHIRKLEPEVGEIFTRVVARCVTGDLNNEGFPAQINQNAINEFLRELQLDDSKAHGDVQRNLERNVINALESCKA